MLVSETTMVRRGEYLERAVVIPHEEGHLEGLYHRGKKSPGVLIAPPHPFDGGGMESTIIAELAWAVTRAGFPTLRFNYRGVGASQGTFKEEIGAFQDLLRAADHLRVSLSHDLEAKNLPPIAALGVGLGGALAAKMALEADFAVMPLMLVSPNADALPDISSYPGEVLFVRAQEDRTSDLEALSAMAEQAKNGRVATVPGADRSFVRGLVHLGKIVAETLEPPGMIDFGE